MENNDSLPVRASTITERESLEISYRLWDFLANNPGKKKEDWPEYDTTGLKYMQSRCPLCARRTVNYTEYDEYTKREFTQAMTHCEGVIAVDEDTLAVVEIVRCPLDGGALSETCADGMFELWSSLGQVLTYTRVCNTPSASDIERKISILSKARAYDRLINYSYVNVSRTPRPDIETEEAILAELAIAARVIADRIKGALDNLTKEESNGLHCAAAFISAH